MFQFVISARSSGELITWGQLRLITGNLGKELVSLQLIIYNWQTKDTTDQVQGSPTGVIRVISLNFFDFTTSQR